MRNRFDDQLIELNNNLTLMGALCENAISLAIKAFLTGNQSHVQKVVAVEQEIDNKEKEIEQQCMRLLLQQQPVARDLRLISSALRMITDMERIGDQALDIAELTEYTTAADLPTATHIKKMAQEAIKMVTDAIESFVHSDLELAESVIAYDDVVDALFSTVRNDIMELIKTDHSNGEAIIDALMIAKYLERIGDHATNIAEWVVYSITGTHKEI